MNGDEQAAAAAVPMRLVEAWAKHDAQAFAEIFTEDGTMTLPNLFVKGRADIRAFMQEAFGGPYKGTRVTGQPIDMRFLSGDVAFLITAGGVMVPGETEVSAERAVHGSWVVVKRNGQWQLAAYQNSQRSI